MKNKILLTLLLGLVLISLGSAYTWGTQKQGECIEIREVCPLPFCNETTIQAITYPNSTLIISNTNANHTGTIWNYTLCSTSVLGTYNVYGYSTNSTINESFHGDFRVESTWLEQTTAQGIGSAIYLILMVVLMFTFGIVGFKLFKTDTLWVLGVFFVFLAVLLLIYNTWLGYEFHRNLTGFSDSSIPEIIFYSFLLLLVLGFLVGLALLFLHWKKIFKYFKREIKRKESKDEDLEDWDFGDDLGRR